MRLITKFRSIYRSEFNSTRRELIATNVMALSIAALGVVCLLISHRIVEAMTLLGVLGVALPSLPTPGGNTTCHCGSGKKYKHCHGDPTTGGATLNLGDNPVLRALKQQLGKAPATVYQIDDPLRRKTRSWEAFGLTEPGEARSVVHVHQIPAYAPPKLTYREKRMRTVAHLQQVIEWFNTSFEKVGVSARIDGEILLHEITRSGSNGHSAIDAFFRMINEDGETEEVTSGFIWPNTVVNLVERILPRFVKDVSTPILNLLGNCQSGKTTQNLVMFFLGPIIYVLTTANYILDPSSGYPVVYYPILFVPNRDSLEEESDKGVENLIDLYGRLEFKSTEVDVPPETILSYIDKLALDKFQALTEHYRVSTDEGTIRVGLSSYIDNIMEQPKRDLRKAYSAYLGRKIATVAKKKLAFLIAKRVNGRQMNDIRDFLQRVLDGVGQNGLPKELTNVRREFLLLLDEADHGSAGKTDYQLDEHDDDEIEKKREEGVFSYFLGLRINYRGKRQSILRICTNIEVGSTLLNISATLYEYFSLQNNTTTVTLKAGQGYYGPNVYRGGIIDPDVPCRDMLRDIWGVSKTIDAVNKWLPQGEDIDFLRYVNRNAFGNQDKLEVYAAQMGGKGVTWFQAQSVHGTARQQKQQLSALYDEACADVLGRLLRWCTRPVPDGKGGMVRHNVAIRFHSSRDGTNRMIEMLEKRQLNAAIASWDGESEHVRAPQFYRAYGGSGLPVIMFVVGKARRGDQFPKSVRYFLDLTKLSSTQTSMEQGMVGRSSGYNKFDPNLDHPDGKGKGFGNLIIVSDDEARNTHRWYGHRGAFDQTNRRLSLRSKSLFGPMEPFGTDVAFRKNVHPKLDDLLARMQTLVDCLVARDEVKRQLPRKGGTEPTLALLTRAEKWLTNNGYLPKLKREIRFSANGRRYLRVFDDDVDLNTLLAENPQCLHDLDIPATRLRVLVRDDVTNKNIWWDEHGIRPYELLEQDTHFAVVSIQWAKDTVNLYQNRHIHGNVIAERRKKERRGSAAGAREGFTAIIVNVVRVENGLLVRNPEVDERGRFKNKGEWIVTNIVFKCAEPELADRTDAHNSGVLNDKESLASDIARVSGVF